jgi:hypothetical protein
MKNIGWQESKVKTVLKLVIGNLYLGEVKFTRIQVEKMSLPLTLTLSQ